MAVDPHGSQRDTIVVHPGALDAIVAAARGFTHWQPAGCKALSALALGFLNEVFLEALHEFAAVSSPSEGRGYVAASLQLLSSSSALWRAPRHA